MKIVLINLFIFVFTIACSKTEIKKGQSFEQIFSIQDTLKLEGLNVISDMVVDTDGFFYIVDQSQAKVLVFDSSLHFIKDIGRKGNGPGEFVFLKGIDMSEDSIYVVDNGKKRVSKFVDTTFIESFGLESHLGRKVNVLDSDKILVAGYKQISLEEGYFLHLYGIDGEFIRSFLENSHALNNDPELVTFAWCDVDLDKSGNLYAIQSTDYKLRKFDQNGNLIFTTDVIPDYYVSPPIGRFPKELTVKNLNKFRRSWHQPTNILCSNDLIVVQTRVSSNLEYNIDIFRADGDLLLSGIPTDYRILCKDIDGYIYLLKQYTEDGAEIIKTSLVSNI